MDVLSRIKRKHIYIFTLLLTIVLYISTLSFRTMASRIVLLFTSNSPELIIGYLNSYNFIKPIVSIGLMVLQAIIIPFKYEIMIFANVKVFGTIIGFVLSTIGRIIGGYICFDIGRVFLSRKIDLLTEKIAKSDFLEPFRNDNLVHILIRLIPLNFNVTSYLSGILGLNLKKYMINSMIWIIFTNFIYSIKMGYFNYSYELAAIWIRLILSFLIFFLGVNKGKNNNSLIASVIKKFNKK